MTSITAEVYTWHRTAPPDEPGRPRLLWAAPGSIGSAKLEAAWCRRCEVGDLAAVPGPWAAVLWDPVRSERVVACDPVGVMPVFWAPTDDGAIAVASWLAQLVDRPDVDDSLDYEGIVIDEGRNCLNDTVAHRTRFSAVARVPWGRAVRFGTGAPRTVRYWDPQAHRTNASLSPQDCVDVLRGRIDSAVRRLTADRATYGSHVSGGLDCTAVACRANQVLGERGDGLVAGYSWAPSEQTVPRFPGDERDLLDDVSAQEGIKIRTVHPDESGDWFRTRDINRYAQSTHIREIWTLPQARADGADIMLSGWGGDELASFNGRAVATHLARRGRWPTVWREAVRRADLLEGPAKRHLVRAVASTALAGAPMPVRSAAYRVRNRADAAQRARISAEVEAGIRRFSPLVADIWQERRRTMERLSDPWRYRLELLGNGHLQHRTMWWYQTGRLFGLHYRYPLLDLEVVTAALQMPWWAFRSDGWTRVAYRRAVEPWVPTSVAWKKDKSETALFRPPVRRPVQRRAPAPRVAALDDDHLREALRIVAMSYR